MRVGVFTNNYKPLVSGVTTYISMLRRELKRRGHRVYVFAPKYPGYVDEEDDVYRYPTVPSLVHPSFRIPVPFSQQIDSQLRKEKIDLVHVQHPFVLGPHGLKLGRRLGVPVVFTYHSIYENFSYVAPLPDRVVAWYSLRKVVGFCNACDLVIAPTAAVAEMIRARGVRSPVKIIPTGIDLSYVQRADGSRLRSVHGLREDQKVLLYIGRITPEKAVDFILRSFQIVARAFPESVLIIVGRDEMNIAHPLIKELGLERRVIVVDYVSYEEIFSYYLLADVFLFASYGETQGIVLTECLASGLPVVAVRAIGANELVRNGLTGFLVDRDEAAFAAKVVELLTNGELRKQMSSNAIAESKAYSIERTADELERSYMELVGTRRKPN